MRNASDPSFAVADARVLDACWAHYVATGLPPSLTDEDRRLARSAFDGGARALYDLLTRMQSMAHDRGDAPLDLARVGRLLGLDEDMALNG